MHTVTVYCDGLCEPNPGGVATFGWVAYLGSKKLHEACAVVCSGDGATNNVAEYSGIMAALGWLIANGYAKDKVILQSDSELCIKQLNGLYRVKAPLVRPLYQQVKALAREFRDLYFQWIPRSRNVEADRLSRVAFENHSRSFGFTREARAGKLLDHVVRIGPAVYQVESQSSPGTFYMVNLAIPACDCPDFQKRGKRVGYCKHILAAQKFAAGEDAVAGV